MVWSNNSVCPWDLRAKKFGKGSINKVSGAMEEKAKEEECIELKPFLLPCDPQRGDKRKEMSI